MAKTASNQIHASYRPQASATRLRQVELLVGVVCSVGVSLVHLLMWWHVGPMWRDEAVSVEVATLPSVAEIWTHLQCDSFPLLWPALLRLWVCLPSVESDSAIRGLGLLIGVAIVGALWLAPRHSTAPAPLVSLILLASNASVMWVGGAIRGYGLGMLLEILLFAALWRAIKTGRSVDWFLAMCAALAAVHSLFHNVVCVFACSCAGCAVLLHRRNWRAALIPPAIGALCALSLAPYAFTLASSKDWVSIVRYPVTSVWICLKFTETFAQAGTLLLAFWCGALILGLMAACLTMLPRWRSILFGDGGELAIYSSVVFLVGTACYFLFLRALRYYMQPWYFMSFLAMAAVCLQGLLDIQVPLVPQKLRLSIFALSVGAGVLTMIPAAQQRRTNLDVVAKHICDNTSPDDLVVVSPWYFGHTFRREYSGPAPWITIPPLPFPHRHNELGLMGLKRQMEHPNEAMQEVLDKAKATLQKGRRLWLVGTIIIPPAGSHVGTAPAYTAESPLHDGDYYTFWGCKLGELLRNHAQRVDQVAVRADVPVDWYEDVPLLVFDGWRP